jgi:hypothetical protein
MTQLLVAVLILTGLIYTVLLAGRRIDSGGRRLAASFVLAVAAPLVALTMCTLIGQP